MKIALVNYRYFISGGPERYLFNVKSLLEAQGHEVIPFSVQNKRNVPSEYEDYLTSNKGFRPIAMQCLVAGALKTAEAMDYVCRFPKTESVLFGASSKAHIQENRDLIEKGLLR